MLSLKGNTGGEHDLIINELIKVHQRFQARISEYRTLLTMSIKFYKDLEEVSLHNGMPSSTSGLVKLLN